MKKMLPALFLCLLAMAGGAQALETDDLIAITAMPLAVSEVAALPDVPRDDLFSVIGTLNRAAVPAPQFIEVVRYAPVALVDVSAQPRFVTFVTNEYDRGIVGQPLALAIADRYQTYGVTEVNVVDPPVLRIVERREILPRVVITRFEPVQWDPVSLVAMPLAVAAISELSDIPRTDLVQFITALNQADMPPPQFIEVVRYSPVVLVDRTEYPRFIEYVNTEIDSGVRGRPLAYAIADRFRTAGVETIDVVHPQPVTVVDRTFLERSAVTSHPHGGPPGQLKKQLGLQTGAEVVHQERVRPARVRPVRTERVVTQRHHPPKRERVVVTQPRVVAPKHVEKQHVQRVQPAPQPRVVKEHGNPGGAGHGNAAGRGNSGGGKNKGKGKGH
jgi:hypothetical protein